jgi:AraC family transcriptional regulator
MQSESSSQIRSLFRGSSSILGLSSRKLDWNGFTIEHHKVAVGEKPETALEQPFVAVWTERCCGELQDSRGKFVPFSKRPGSINLLPTGLVVPWRLSSSTEVTVVAFETEFVNSVEEELDRRLTMPFLGKLAIEDPQLSMLVSLLMRESDSGGLHGRIYGESLAQAIAIRFIHLGRGERLRETVYRRISSSESVRRVLDRMHDELQADLSLRTLAAETGYSRRHFLRIFEEATGCSPHQYLLQLRMRRAKELIRTTSMPLIDIAAHSGFSSQSHMSQIFRRFCDATPGQMRKDLTCSRKEDSC